MQVRQAKLGDTLVLVSASGTEVWPSRGPRPSLGRGGAYSGEKMTFVHSEEFCEVRGWNSATPP